MDAETARGFLLPLTVSVAAIGSGLGLGKAVGSAMEAMARQPEAAGKIKTVFLSARHLSRL